MFSLSVPDENIYTHTHRGCPKKKNSPITSNTDNPHHTVNCW